MNNLLGDARNAAGRKTFTDLVREEMNVQELAQADKLNAAFLEFNKLTKELTDIRERVDIAAAIFAREERIWKDMLNDRAK